MRYSVHREWKRQARVAVGVPTYNGAERVAWLFQSIERAGGLGRDSGSVAYTVLDDGSTRGGQREQLLGIANQYGANFVAHHKNEGITRSWNDLVRFVDAPVSVLLNDDLLVLPDWLENLEYFVQQNDCGAAAWNTLFCSESDVPRILAGETVTPRHPITRAPQPELANQSDDEPPGVVMCALGCGFGFKRSVFDRLGGFDERTVMHHNESWFGTAAAANLKLPSYNIPAPRAWHLWSATFKDNPELHERMGGDAQAYISFWGGDFQGPNGTHPRFMVGTMPPRVVRWIGPDGQRREKEMTVQ